MVAVPTEYKRICADIKRLSMLKKEIGSEGSFLQVSDKAFYVYGHKAHTSYSSVDICDFVAIGTKLSEKTSFLSVCNEREGCHEVFYPYFYANNQCRFLLNSAHGSNALTQLKDMSEDDAGNLCENDWTYRLHVCFGTKKIKSEFTAQLFPVGKSWKSRLPDDIGENCLVFQGTPDLIITVKKNEGIIMSNTSAAATEDDPENENDLPSSRESG